MSDPKDSAPSNFQLSRRSASVIFLMAALLVLTVAAWRGATKSDVVWIFDDEDAHWVKPGVYTSLGVYEVYDRDVTYKREFNLDGVPPSAPLVVEVIKKAEVTINGEVLPLSIGPRRDGSHVIDIYPFLRTGSNTIEIKVTDDRGPCLLRASAPAIGLRTNDEWKFFSSYTGSGRANLATTSPRPKLIRNYEVTPQKGLNILPVLLLVFLVSWLAIQRMMNSERIVSRLTPWHARNLVMIAYVVLAANNLLKVPYENGMDYTDHFQYIHFILAEHRLPLASDGLFAFRLPLAYMIGAPIMALLLTITEPETAKLAIRVLPFMAGLAYIEIVFRIFSLLFKERPRYIIIGTLVGAFLPVNVYMSHYLSDEPAAGIMGACAILLSIQLLHQTHAPTWRQSVCAGAIIGFALLSKLSVVFLIPPCFLAMVLAHQKTNTSSAPYTSPLIKNLLLATITCALVAGWYYIRNWIHLGTPVVAGWDNDTYAWWQNPGFRTPTQYLTFGRAFTYPVFSAVNGFWDGLYSTFWLDGWSPETSHWNLGFLMAGAWLGIVPMALLGLGAAHPLIRMYRTKRAAWTSDDQITLYTNFCVTLYLAAILYLHLTTPIYSAVKGSYFYAVLPCIALLIVRGIVALDKISGPRGQTILYAFMLTWAINSYISYFAVS